MILINMNIVIMIPFLAAIFIPILTGRMSPSYKKNSLHIGWFVFLVPAALFIAIARYIPSIANGTVYYDTMKWIPSFNIDFTAYLDGLSMIFGLLITGIGSLVILYSIYYLSSDESLRHFYIYLLLFMGSMLGVVFSDNLMVLYVFWELTSISSFLLIAFWFHRKGSRYGAQKAMLITVTGGLAMLTSFIMIYLMTGTMSIREIVTAVDIEHPLFLPALVLLLIGAFTKSAQFPFHIWLPDAMEAPTPVSAYLHSATMVKAGIYLVARFTPIFGGEELWFWLVTATGLVTLFWGSFTAVRQTDLKALLAYSTISQLGLIMCLLGVGSMSLYKGASMETVLFTQATFAGLFHLINHSTFKGALFMVVGIVDHEVGTRDIRRLGGLMSLMPVSFTIAMIGSFSMAGLPPFNGFLSKEMFFTAVLNVTEHDLLLLDTWGILIPVIAWVASIFTFVYSMIIVFKTFMGTSRLDAVDRRVREAPVGMLIPPSVLALLVMGIFFFPNIVGDFLLRPAMAGIFPTLVDTVELSHPILIWHGFNMELFMTIGVVVFGGLLYKYMRKWKKIYTLFPASWSLDALYNHTLLRLESGSSAVTRFYMTGVLRDYLLYIYFFFTVAIGGALWLTGAFSIDRVNDAPVRLYEWVLILVMMAAGIAIPFVRTRVTAVLLTGVLGYGISALFVLFRAPDLALTQIVVETVTTALFLLCFFFLPKWYRGKEKTAPRAKAINWLISISVGVIFVMTALSVQSGKLFSSISVFFERADELTGGKNIVNAILGDFRAFDTMLEVVVLFIAGLGVFTLTRLKLGKGGENVEDQ